MCACVLAVVQACMRACVVFMYIFIIIYFASYAVQRLIFCSVKRQTVNLWSLQVINKIVYS